MKRLVIALAALVLIASAAHAQVAIDYDHSVDFRKFKTYTWGKVHATDPGVEDRITIALNRDMQDRFMNEVGKNGDLTITAVEATGNPQEVTDFYSSLSDWPWQRSWNGASAGFLDNAATPADVPLNTLVIDMYDTKTHKLFWRGSVTGLHPAGQDKNDRTIDKAVTELIDKYPPKFKK